MTPKLEIPGHIIPANEYTKVISLDCDPTYKVTIEIDDIVFYDTTPLFQTSPIVLGREVQYLPINNGHGTVNKLNSIMKRVLPIRPKVSEHRKKHFNIFMERVALPQIKKEVDYYLDGNRLIYDPDSWLDHFVGGKKNEMINALSNARNKLLSDSRFTVFGKIEKIVNTDNDLKMPRTISCQSPEVRALLGPFYYAIEKMWPKILCYYSKPANNEDLASFITEYFIDEGNHVMIEGDFSSYDSTNQSFFMDYDKDIYNYLYSKMEFQEEDVNLRKFFNETNLIINDYELNAKMSLDGQVPSGKGNTTEGNTRRSGLIFWYWCWFRIIA